MKHFRTWTYRIIISSGLVAVPHADDCSNLSVDYFPIPGIAVEKQLVTTNEVQSFPAGEQIWRLVHRSVTAVRKRSRVTYGIPRA